MYHWRELLHLLPVSSQCACLIKTGLNIQMLSRLYFLHLSVLCLAAVSVCFHGPGDQNKSKTSLSNVRQTCKLLIFIPCIITLIWLYKNPLHHIKHLSISHHHTMVQLQRLSCESKMTALKNWSYIMWVCSNSSVKLFHCQSGYFSINSSLQSFTWLPSNRNLFRLLTQGCKETRKVSQLWLFVLKVVHVQRISDEFRSCNSFAAAYSNCNSFVVSNTVRSFGSGRSSAIWMIFVRRQQSATSGTFCEIRNILPQKHKRCKAKKKKPSKPENNVYRKYSRPAGGTAASLSGLFAAL